MSDDFDFFDDDDSFDLFTDDDSFISSSGSHRKWSPQEDVPLVDPLLEDRYESFDFDLYRETVSSRSRRCADDLDLFGDGDFAFGSIASASSADNLDEETTPEFELISIPQSVVQHYVRALIAQGRHAAAIMMVKRSVPARHQKVETRQLILESARLGDYRAAVRMGMLSMALDLGDHWSDLLEVALKQEQLDALRTALMAHRAAHYRLFVLFEMAYALAEREHPQTADIWSGCITLARTIRNPQAAVNGLGTVARFASILAIGPTVLNALLPQEDQFDDDLLSVLRRLYPEILDRAMVADLYRDYLNALRRRCVESRDNLHSVIHDFFVADFPFGSLALMGGHGAVALEWLDLLTRYHDRLDVKFSQVFEQWVIALWCLTLAQYRDNPYLLLLLLDGDQDYQGLSSSELPAVLALADSYRVQVGTPQRWPVMALRGAIAESEDADDRAEGLGWLATMLLLNDQADDADAALAGLLALDTSAATIKVLCHCALILTIVQHPRRQTIVDELCIQLDTLSADTLKRQYLGDEVGGVLLAQLLHGQVAEADAFLERLSVGLRWEVLGHVWDMVDDPDDWLIDDDLEPLLTPSGRIQLLDAGRALPGYLRDRTLRWLTGPEPEHDADWIMVGIALDMNGQDFPDEALRVIEFIHDPAARDEALTNLLPRLDWPLDRLQPLVESIRDENIRNTTFDVLARARLKADQWLEARHYARQITFTDERARLLREIALAMARNTDTQAEATFEEAIQVARSVQHRRLRRVAPSLLREVARAMPPDSLLSPLSDPAAKNQPDSRRDALRCGLVEALCRAGRVQAAEQVAALVGVEPWRREAWAAVVETYAANGAVTEAEARLQAAPDHPARVRLHTAYAAGWLRAGGDVGLDAARAAVDALPQAHQRAAALRTLALALLPIDKHRAEPFVAEAIQFTTDQPEHLSAFYGLCALLDGLLAVADTRTDAVLNQIEGLLTAESKPPAVAEVGSPLLEGPAQQTRDDLWQHVSLNGPIWEMDARLEVAAILNKHGHMTEAQKWIDAAQVDQGRERFIWPLEPRLNRLTPARDDVCAAFARLDSYPLPTVLDVLIDWSPIFEQIEVGLTVQIQAGALRLFAWVGYDFSAGLLR